MAEVEHTTGSGGDARGGSAGSSGQGLDMNQAEPWKLLGRDSPAGKALFKLYGGDPARVAGNKYHAKNALKHQQKVASGYSPPPLEPERPVIQKPSVSYPQFGVGAKKMSAPPPIAYVHRRRPGDVIKAEMEQDAERFRDEVKHCPPRGPLLDDAEKDRCANLMQYRGKVYKPTTAELEEAARARGARRPKSEAQELQDMFDQVVGEIEERRSFLKELGDAGRLKQETEKQVKYEIQQRVADMERIDRMLKEATLAEKRDGQ